MANESARNMDERPIDDVVDAIVSELGLHECIETHAATDDHAAEVAESIANASAHRARFEDTLDAS